MPRHKVLKTNGILVAAFAHEDNCDDGHNLLEVFEKTEVVQGERPAKAIVDRVNRGARDGGGTQIPVPGKLQPRVCQHRS